MPSMMTKIISASSACSKGSDHLRHSPPAICAMTSAAQVFSQDLADVRLRQLVAELPTRLGTL